MTTALDGDAQEIGVARDQRNVLLCCCVKGNQTLRRNTLRADCQQSQQRTSSVTTIRRALDIVILSFHIVLFRSECSNVSSTQTPGPPPAIDSAVRIIEAQMRPAVSTREVPVFGIAVLENAQPIVASARHPLRKIVPWLCALANEQCVR